MNRKIIGALVAIIMASVVYYLVSPLWRVVEKNDVSPLKTFQSASPIAPAPVVLARGVLEPKAHDVEGEVLVIESGGQRTLRFENLDTINGPDLRIYLSSSLDDKDIVDLGPIQGTKGNVNYEIGRTVDLLKFNKVLVWCKQFGVLFSYAELQ